MNKKLLAAAIAAAMVAPAAYAQATMYGKFHASIDANDFEVKNCVDCDTDNYSVESRASRVGIKGSEDLGGGLKAIYQAEFTVNVDGNESSLAGQDGGDGWGGQRNTFIGLAGGFGTFLVGRHDTPAKVAFYATGNDRLGDSIIDLNGSVLGVFTEYRADNGIAYVSPNFSGFTFAAAVIPGEESETATSNEVDGLADHWSIGLMYAGGGLKAGVGYEEFDNQGNSLTIMNGAIPLGGAGGAGILAQTSSVDNADIEVLQAGASYTFGAFSVGAQYQDTDIDTLGTVNPPAGALAAPGVDYEYTAWALTGKATFGNNAISIVYTDAELEAGGAYSGDVAESDGWGIAAEHNFSKRTKVYAAYADSEFDLDSSAAVALGTAEEDEEKSVFSLGMIHNF